MKKIAATLLTMAMLTSLAACGSSDKDKTDTSDKGGSTSKTSAEGEGTEDASGGKEYASPEFTIKLGTSDNNTSLMFASLDNFANNVSEQSKGRVKVDIYTSEQLGSNAEMAEMITMGSLDAMMIPQGEEAKYAPKMNALGLPFLFSGYPEVYAVLDSEIGNSLVEEDLANNNMVQLAYWENGLRQITNSARSIEKPEDLSGLKIRTPEDSLTIETFKALGASPSPLAFSELYLALQQGTFDGQENPVVNVYDNNLNDVQKYMSITNHKYECKNMVFCKSIFEGYPEEIQDMLKEAAKTYGQEQRDAVVNSTDKMLKELEEGGMVISTPDTAPFQESCESVYENFYKENAWGEDLVKQIQDKIASVN